MATATGITIVKRFAYRGNANEEFANSYWFKPVAPPTTDAAWRTLLDAIVASEKPIYPSNVNVIRAYGYADDTGHKPGDTGAVAPAVYSVDFRVAPEVIVPGTLSVGTGIVMPGDDAVWIRWKTQRRTSPGGKPIYVRKYFHPAYSVSTGGDSIFATQKTNLLAHAAKMYDGTLPGARTIVTPGTLDTISDHGASSFITTRTLKRRGRRP